jgi:hypothetical protein
VLLCAELSQAQTWVQKISGSGLGNSLRVNPLNSNVLYGSPGTRFVYISRDRGYTWQQYGSPVPAFGPSPNAIKSIAVNPNDTLQLLVGVESSSGDVDRIMKTTNGGASWTLTWGGSFYYYGKPVEFKPEHPDTVYTMGNDTLWRSIDFGSTWDTVTVRRGADFDAWCDAELRPDSANIMFLGDAGTGIWKTTDHGVTWRHVYTAIASGEVPAIAIDPFNYQTMYATRFSGGGGVIKSTNGGETWAAITTPIGISSSWWITCSAVHPNFVYFGVYFTGTTAGVYISRNAGASWENLDAGFSSTAKFNYGLLALDSLTVIAGQQNGLYKLQYTPSIHVVNPNGGETFTSGVHHTIEWTATNLYAVKLDYTTNNGAGWITIEDSIPVSQQSYDWIVPSTISSQYRVRVSDRLFTATKDTSDTTFSVNPLLLASPNGGEVWNSGSYHTISWSENEFSENSLYYSIDSGMSWSYITKIANPVHEYQWFVPLGITSTNCSVKVVNSADSNVYDASNSVFSVLTRSTFHAFLKFTDNGAEKDSLAFGTISGATDGIDTALGESERSPKPPQGTFDVRWFIPSTNGTSLDYRDTLSNVHQQNVYLAEMQPGVGGYPFTISWEIDSLDSGMFVLRDSTTHGGLLQVDMKKQNSVVVSDTSIKVIEILQCMNVVITYGTNGGWNLLSVPVSVADWRKSAMFPYSQSEAFAYNGSYFVQDTLRMGRGYWLKMEQATVVGCTRLVDTIDVGKGWNIVGSVSAPVSVSSIVAVPDSIISSNYFGYSGGYSVASTIEPGGGYWVKAKAQGKLILSASGMSPSSNLKQQVFSGLNRLTVSNEAGRSQSLYFGVEDGVFSPERYQMPPLPPEGGFDARFASQRMIEMHPKTLEIDMEYSLLIAPGFNKIFFAWSVENDENFSYILIEKSNNKEIATPLEGSGSLLIQRRNQSAFAIKVQERTERTERPIGYELGEVYPNPFNPKAHIQYSVPFDSRVNISVYSTLGEEVAVLADVVQRRGVYTLEWNGTRNDGSVVSSGVYFIRMHAAPEEPDRTQNSPSFVGVRKVLLMK